MALQTFTAGQVLTAAQMTSLQANDYNQTVSTKTASYTLVAADKGTRVVMNSASATTITVNTSLFSAGDTLFLQNISTGVCTVTAGTATVSSAGSLAIPQNGSGILYFTSAGVSVYYPSATSSAKFGQVIQGTLSTSFTTSSSSYISTGLTATITPTSASSTILVMYTGPMAAVSGLDIFTTVFRGTVAGTNLGNTNGFSFSYNPASATMGAHIAGIIIDSPATTSATTYTVAMKVAGAGSGVFVSNTGRASLTLIEVLA